MDREASSRRRRRLDSAENGRTLERRGQEIALGNIWREGFAHSSVLELRRRLMSRIFSAWVAADFPEALPTCHSPRDGRGAY